MYCNLDNDFLVFNISCFLEIDYFGQPLADIDQQWRGPTMVVFRIIVKVELRAVVPFQGSFDMEALGLRFEAS